MILSTESVRMLKNATARTFLLWSANCREGKLSESISVAFLFEKEVTQCDGVLWAANRVHSDGRLPMRFCIFRQISSLRAKSAHPKGTLDNSEIIKGSSVAGCTLDHKLIISLGFMQQRVPILIVVP